MENIQRVFADLDLAKKRLPIYAQKQGVNTYLYRIYYDNHSQTEYSFRTTAEIVAEDSPNILILQEAHTFKDKGTEKKLLGRLITFNC